ncbi:uncharacterized protein [Epargyreus clarus]|uniref:uncharacterized protein n=1 Tax=Epargyreus clarus TaxID=520877 RepID=UPI003C3019D7
MDQLSNDNVQNFKCNQNSTSTKNKNKKAKDPPETTDEISIASDELSESLVNCLQINKVSSNLTNGTSVHSTDSVELETPNAQVAASSDGAGNVNSVQCCDDAVEAEACDIGVSWVRYVEDKCVESAQKAEDSVHTGQNEYEDDEFKIIAYESEIQMPEIMSLIQKDLSEPYSIYTYRYFIHNWPKLCFLATDANGKCIGAIVCKLDMHRNVVKRGYIAMLAVEEKYRKRRIGSRLVQKAIQVMIEDNAAEVVLETEITNKPALRLYENLGFVRDKRLFRYYLNGVDALRLKLWLR